jgi:alanyl-tRNA synthetase
MNTKLTSIEIRSKFLKFFEKRGHVIIPSASLIPENDPTVLFNTAGMQPLVPYLMGIPHPLGDKLVDVQKCVRTNDIEEVGDNTHLTFFEMLGNWSLGSYFKQDAIKWSYELLTDKVEGFGLDPRRLYVTCYEGDSKTPRDEESSNRWKEMFDKDGITGNRIFFLGPDANWWPAVKNNKDGWTGPTGPCSEMFYDLTGKLTEGLTPEEFAENDSKQNIVEIWNDVFMEYVKENGVIVRKLDKQNVDTGSGLERIATVIQGKNNVFETDLFEPIISKIKEISKAYNEKSARVVADHVRASVMLIADGITPSNSDQGYILRRLIRRAVRHADNLKTFSGLVEIVEVVQTNYKDIYPNIVSRDNGLYIQKIIQDEEAKFRITIEKGLKEFEKGTDAFTLFSSYGFPLELTLELAKERGVKIDIEKFNEEFKKHQDLSRSGAEQKFKGGLADTSEMSVRYHTATHLLHQALHDVLGEGVGQKGSNITPERLRFDFSYDKKMTDEEKKRVEDIVNDKISKALPVQNISLPKAEAEKTGARHFFGEKYGDIISIYFIGNSLETAYSKEFCGGPHVKNTSELGTFKIQKEEASSQGVRRIKAVLS